MTRLKIAELTSGVGALVLGVGLGALFPQWFAPAAGVIALAGVIAHALGMWDKHRLESQAHAPSEPWVTGLYWVRHAQIRDPALSMLALMEKLRVEAPAGRPPINRQKERANGGVRVHRRS